MFTTNRLLACKNDEPRCGERLSANFALHPVLMFRHWLKSVQSTLLTVSDKHSADPITILLLDDIGIAAIHRGPFELDWVVLACSCIKSQGQFHLNQKTWRNVNLKVNFLNQGNWIVNFEEIGNQEGIGKEGQKTGSMLNAIILGRVREIKNRVVCLVAIETN